MCLNADMQAAFPLARIGAVSLVRSLFVAWLAASAVAACGGSAPPPAAPKTQAAPKEASTKPKAKFAMEGQLGSLDEGKVDQTFGTLMPRFNDCLSQGSSRVEFIGGHVKFSIRIGIDGATKWAFLSESTLGDRDTERCMLSAVKSARWPQPQ